MRWGEGRPSGCLERSDGEMTAPFLPRSGPTTRLRNNSTAGAPVSLCGTLATPNQSRSPRRRLNRSVGTRDPSATVASPDSGTGIASRKRRRSSSATPRSSPCKRFRDAIGAFAHLQSLLVSTKCGESGRASSRFCVAFLILPNSAEFAWSPARGPRVRTAYVRPVSVAVARRRRPSWLERTRFAPRHARGAARDRRRRRWCWDSLAARSDRA